MLSSELLNILRCPLNPTRAKLQLQGQSLTCESCALRFPIQDGFPILVIAEAILPEGCESLMQLPCQSEQGARPVWGLEPQAAPEQSSPAPPAPLPPSS